MSNPKGSSFRKSLFLIVLFFGALLVFGAYTLLSVHAQDNPYFRSTNFTVNGKSIQMDVINGPSHPPAGYEFRACLPPPIR
jgi:hypothetical protein